MIKKINYNLIIVLLSIVILIFVPELRVSVLIYSAMFLLIEGVNPGIDRPTRSFKQVFIPLVIGLVGAFLITKTFGGEVSVWNYSLLVGLIYFKLVAYYEESIFRVILPKYIGPILSTFLYAVFHIMLISSITSNLLLGFAYFITTLIFGGVMMLIYMKTKKFGFIDGFHWGFDLVKGGVL